MIESLRVSNFRSIADSGELIFSKFNVLLGVNNSGKSSVLAILLMLKQTLLDKDSGTVLVTSGPLIDLGSYVDMVRDDPESKPLQIAFRLTASHLMNIPFFPGDEEKWWPRSIDEYQFGFLYSSRENEIVVNSFRMKDTSSQREIVGTRKGANWSFEGFPEELAKHLPRVSFVHFLPVFQPELAGTDEKNRTRLSQLQLSSQMNAYVLNNVFERLSYVGPIRERIPRYGVLGTMPFSEITPSGQNLMRVLSAEPKRGEGRAVIKRLNDWLDKKFKMLRNVRMKNLDPGGTVNALIAEDRQGRRKINLAATGAGISQIIPVVVQTVMTKSNGLLIVEQPEVHLHPAAQAALADLFIENLADKQFLIETHSEHFVLRLRRRVAEGKIPSVTVRMLIFDKKESQTKITQLELKPNGDFVDWPEGFFDEGYQEALALAMASQKSVAHAG